jgi:7-carboxy-7-deazaguanine synthase
MSNAVTIEQSLTLAEKTRTDIVRVNEIFFSIQGEGTRSGEPCIFIRLTGCGLRCTYCDTEYAFYEGTDHTLNDIITEIKHYPCTLVELTGGEPLEQQGAYALMNQLCDLGYEVMVETGGHIDISGVDERIKRIVDLKTPSSGMMKRNYLPNIHSLTINDEVKFVIGSREDYLWAKQMIEEHAIGDRAGTILFSPVSDMQPLDELAAWILEDGLNVRLQIQLHKIIWKGIERGV